MISENKIREIQEIFDGSIIPQIEAAPLLVSPGFRKILDSEDVNTPGIIAFFSDKNRLMAKGYIYNKPEYETPRATAVIVEDGLIEYALTIVDCQVSIVCVDPTHGMIGGMADLILDKPISFYGLPSVYTNDVNPTAPPDATVEVKLMSPEPTPAEP